MKPLILLFLLLALTAPSIHAQGEPAPSAAPAVFPMLGKWRVVGTTDSRGVFHTVKNGGTYGFYKSGSMVIIEAGDKEAMYERGWRYDSPGDIYLQTEYHGDSDHAYRIRFHVDGNVATIKSSAIDEKADPDDKPEGTVKLQRIKTGTIKSKISK